MEKLEEALHNHYGALNELTNGIPGMTVKIPPKPEAMVLLEKCETLNLPLVDGGLIDQPHIILQEFAVVIEIREVYRIAAMSSSR